ncbi:MAG: hypothetical protein AAGH57_09665 [Pseudomonadota bacterium]
MDFLKHPMGLLGAGVFLLAIGYTQGFFNGSGAGGRETQADGYAWTDYCEKLRLEVFDMEPGERFVIAYNNRVYPRYQKQYDRMVAADCDPAKGGFRGFTLTR